jgi:hypothetical protein
VTIRAFGWRVFFRAVFGRQGSTFLSLLQKDGCFAAASSTEPELIERCVRVELQAAAIYDRLAERFADSAMLSDFLDELTYEEQEHAELLRVCKAFACRGRFMSHRFSAWHDYVPLLEQQMQQTVDSLDQIAGAENVVRLILQIEGSEINRVFLGIIEATDSPFVKKLGPFRRAVKHHIGYICKKLTAITPSAASACHSLARFADPS